MSAISNDIPPEEPRSGSAPKLPPKALAYYAVVAAVTGRIVALLVARSGKPRSRELALCVGCSRLFAWHGPAGIRR